MNDAKNNNVIVNYKVATPPLKWHGGKNAFGGKLARWLVSLMPPHLHYCEPYFGGGAVLLAKNPDGVSEVVNDWNGDLMNFWAVLRDDFSALMRLLEATPFSEEEFRRALAALSSGQEADPVQRAACFFVACRQSLAGRMDAFAPLSRTRTRRQMNEQASAWLTAIEGLPAVHERLKRVVILHRPALDVIHSQDGDNTLFYLDPPYLHETRTATDTYGPYEMTEGDHRELLDAIRDAKGKVILSGYANDLYNTELQGWNRHEFDMPNNAASGKKKRVMTEMVWCNF